MRERDGVERSLKVQYEMAAATECLLVENISSSWHVERQGCREANGKGEEGREKEK